MAPARPLAGAASQVPDKDGAILVPGRWGSALSGSARSRLTPCSCISNRQRLLIRFHALPLAQAIHAAHAERQSAARIRGGLRAGGSRAGEMRGRRPWQRSLLNRVGRRRHAAGGEQFLQASPTSRIAVTGSHASDTCCDKARRQPRYEAQSSCFKKVWRMSSASKVPSVGSGCLYEFMTQDLSAMGRIFHSAAGVGS